MLVCPQPKIYFSKFVLTSEFCLISLFETPFFQCATECSKSGIYTLYRSCFYCCILGLLYINYEIIIIQLKQMFVSSYCARCVQKTKMRGMCICKRVIDPELFKKQTKLHFLHVFSPNHLQHRIENLKKEMKRFVLT